MLCPNCKRIIEGNPEFCPDCGIGLTLVMSDTAEEEPVVLVEEQPFTIEVPRKKKSPLGVISVLLGIVGALLAVIAGVIWTLIKIGSVIPVLNAFVSVLNFVPISGPLCIVGILLSAVGLVLGIIAKVKGCKAAGMVVSIIGLVLGIAVFVITTIINLLIAVAGAGVGILAILDFLFSMYLIES